MQTPTIPGLVVTPMVIPEPPTPISSGPAPAGGLAWRKGSSWGSQGVAWRHSWAGCTLAVRPRCHVPVVLARVQ